MSVVGTAIAQVILQRASQAKHEGVLPQLVEGAFRPLVILSLFPMLMLSLIGRDLFVTVLGAPWSEAGVYAQILSIWMFVWFVSSPLSTLFNVLERQEKALAINILIFGTRVASLWVGGVLGSARLAIVLFAVTGVIVYGYLAFAVVVAAGVPWNSVFKVLAGQVLVFLPAGGLIVAMYGLHFPIWAILIVSLALTVAYYAYQLASEPALAPVKDWWFSRRIRPYAGLESGELR
jgi:lipopolysaccharide exporter